MLAKKQSMSLPWIRNKAILILQLEEFLPLEKGMQINWYILNAILLHKFILYKY